MRIFLITILLVVSNVSFAQHDGQSFSTRNFKHVADHYSRESRCLLLEVDVAYTKEINSFRDRNYRLGCYLMLEDSLIYTSERFSSITAERFFHDDPKIDFDRELLIPYTDLNLSPGQYDLTVTFFARHYDGIEFPDVGTHSFKTKIPELRKVDYYDNEFEIVKVQTETDKHEFVRPHITGIEIETDVVRKYGPDEITCNDPNCASMKTWLVYEVFDAEGNKVFPDTSINWDKKSEPIYPEYTWRRNEYGKDLFDETFFLPYYLINAQGDFRGTLKVSVASFDDTHRFKDAFQEVPISFVKPIQYPDTSQTIDISNFTFVSNENQPENGMEFQFDVELRYLRQQLIGSEENQGIGTYRLNLILRNENQVIFEPDVVEYPVYQDNIGTTIISADQLSYKRLKVTVPYELVQWPSEYSDINAELEVESDGNKWPEKGIQKQISVAAPESYLARIVVSDLSIFHGTDYDFAFAPSRRNPSRGRGYPDIYWALRSNLHSKVSSGVSSNSFSMSTKERYFRVMDHEVLTLVVNDQDGLSADDRLGTFHIGQVDTIPIGIAKTKASGDVKEIKYLIEKQPFPNVSFSDVELRDFNSVTRVSQFLLKGELKGDGLLNLKPTMSIRQMVNGEWLDLSGVYSRLDTIDENTISFMHTIPKIVLRENGEIALGSILGSSELRLAEHRVDYPSISELDDVTFNCRCKETTYENRFGLSCEVNPSWNTYYDQHGHDDGIFFSYRLTTPGDTSNLLNIHDQKFSYRDWNSFSNYNHSYYRSNYNFFIPYTQSKLAKGTNLNLSVQASYRDRIIMGRMDTSIIVRNAGLAHITLNTLNIKLKRFVEVDSVSLHLSHPGFQGQPQVVFPKDNKISANLGTEAVVVHPNDKCTLHMRLYYTSGKVRDVSWHFKGYQLQGEGRLKLPSTSYTKKGKVGYEKSVK